MFEDKVRYFIPGKKEGEAEAVAIICPLISEEMSDRNKRLRPLPLKWKTSLK